MGLCAWSQVRRRQALRQVSVTALRLHIISMRRARAVQVLAEHQRRLHCWMASASAVAEATRPGPAAAALAGRTGICWDPERELRRVGMPRVGRRIGELVCGVVSSTSTAGSWQLGDTCQGARRTWRCTWLREPSEQGGWSSPTQAEDHLHSRPMPDVAVLQGRGVRQLACSE
ncbi:unnamed protein product [Prorocentrum cordatum]|uniref:Uncharacterized protein n=1 Tax=Prorocentrum cordatum TaxID=2364126 RepID=A0ABN9XVT9_9DINO|nr:unnamed protein product [Polarella glacialis]